MNVSAYTLTSALRGLFRFTANFRQRLATFADSSMFEKNYRLQDIQLSKIRRAFRLGETRPRRIADFLSKSGGEYRARTGDLLVANQALSQLS